MRGCLGKVTRAVVCIFAIGWAGVCTSVPAVGQQQPGQGQPQARPAEPAKPKPFDVCTGLTGANAPTKVAACTEAIKDGKLAPGDLALAYLNRGLAESGPGSDARSKDDYKAAIRIYNELIVGSPLNPHYYTQRGVIYQTIGEADRAILDYSDAVRLAPRETYPLINRGVLLYLKKDNNEGAIADLTAALKLKPCEVSAWANRGIVHKRKGEIDKAITDFSDGIKCLPAKIEPIRQNLVPDAVTSQLSTQQQEHNNLALQAAFIHFQRGLAYYDKLQYDKAIADFSEAVRINPADTSGHVGRGAAYLNKDELHRAIADFSEAIRLSPGQAFAHLQRGIAYHRIGDSDKALDDYSEAIKAHAQGPDSPRQPRHRLLHQEGPVRSGDQRLQQGAGTQPEGGERADQPRHHLPPAR
jgi:tetratricopeptide (TPR) repeat protein